jgi:hypothetical protein
MYESNFIKKKSKIEQLGLKLEAPQQRDSPLECSTHLYKE